MKHFPLLLSGLSAFILVSLPQKANALPFKNDCASMENYFNSLKWSTPTRFSGFKGIPFNIMFPYKEKAFCKGYITETSPMGTRVCFGYIDYLRGQDGRRHIKWAPNNDSSCRWK